MKPYLKYFSAGLLAVCFTSCLVKNEVSNNTNSNALDTVLTYDSSGTVKKRVTFSETNVYTSDSITFTETILDEGCDFTGVPIVDTLTNTTHYFFGATDLVLWFSNSCNALKYTGTPPVGFSGSWTTAGPDTTSIPDTGYSIPAFCSDITPIDSNSYVDNYTEAYTFTPDSVTRDVSINLCMTKEFWGGIINELLWYHANIIGGGTTEAINATIHLDTSTQVREINCDAYSFVFNWKTAIVQSTYTTENDAISGESHILTYGGKSCTMLIDYSAPIDCGPNNDQYLLDFDACVYELGWYPNALPASAAKTSAEPVSSPYKRKHGRSFAGPHSQLFGSH